jgi:arylsulfatase A-like enzyme
MEIPEGAAVDSYSFLPVWTGQDYSSPLREATVHNTYSDIYGLRKGDWLYINDSTGGHRKPSKAFNALPERGYTEFTTEGLLFNMKNDPEQRINLFEEHPEKVVELAEILERYQEQGYSVKRNIQ